MSTQRDDMFTRLVDAIRVEQDRQHTMNLTGVYPEGIAEAVLDCLREADPDAYQLAQRLTQLDGSHGTMGAVPFEALHEQLATLCASLASARAERDRLEAELTDNQFCQRLYNAEEARDRLQLFVDAIPGMEDGFSAAFEALQKDRDLWKARALNTSAKLDREVREMSDEHAVAMEKCERLVMAVGAFVRAHAFEATDDEVRIVRLPRQTFEVGWEELLSALDEAEDAL